MNQVTDAFPDQEHASYNLLRLAAEQKLYDTLTRCRATRQAVYHNKATISRRFGTCNVCFNYINLNWNNGKCEDQSCHGSYSVARIASDQFIKDSLQGEAMLKTNPVICGHTASCVLSGNVPMNIHQANDPIELAHGSPYIMSGKQCRKLTLRLTLAVMCVDMMTGDHVRPHALMALRHMLRDKQEEYNIMKDLHRIKWEIDDEFGMENRHLFREAEGVDENEDTDDESQGDNDFDISGPNQG